MKLLYVTDLHGDKKKYEKVLELAVDQDIKWVINGGDMLPKIGDRHVEQPIFIKEYLRDYFQRLQGHDIQYLTLLGNDDLLFLDELFSDMCREFDNVHDISGRKVNINGYEVIGMNHILDHPFGCKDRVVTEKYYVPQRQLSPVAGISHETGYDKVYNWLEYSGTNLPHMCDIIAELPTSSNRKKTIYVMHMPPAGLKLGQLLYQNLDIGSVDIYEFLKETQPLLTLHDGHIHESPDTPTGKWMNQILHTTCIQTGQTELGDLDLIYADINLESQSYERKRIRVR